MRIGVLISGRGSNLQSLIDNVKSGYIDGEIAVVISDVEDAYGLERAKNAGIPAIFIDPKGKKREDFDAEMAKVLDEHKVGLVCLAGYMRILGNDFVRRYAGRAMNIHPALLPSFPGLDAQEQAFEHGVKVSGCTVHFIDEGVDSGPIIIQRAVPVDEDDDEHTLAARILEQEHKIYPEAVSLFAQGRLKIEGRRVHVLPEK